MRRFFSKVKPDPPEPGVASLGNLANFYSLLIFLIAIPFILIVALVWLTGILGFSAWIFAGFAALCVFIVWRLYRRWGQLKSKVAAQNDEFQDLMREANQAGKDVEISLMNGVLTLRYKGQDRLANALPAGRSQPLALAAPLALGAETVEAAAPAFLPPERLREELEEFIKLRDEGVISPEEFDRIKASLLQRLSA
jgi:membrane protein implicated in regulation of membrane protease activity